MVNICAIMNIFEACRRGNIDRVRELLCRDGFNINSVDDNGDTPLISAVRYGHMDIVTLLVDRGVDMGEGPVGQTPLHVALRHDQTEMVYYLLATGADVNHATKVSRATPLHYACRFTNEEIIAALLAAGAAVDSKDFDGETPVGWIRTADITAWTEKMTLLLNAGADINAVNKNGNTLLHHVVNCKGNDQVRFLLECGARMEIQNAQGQTALDLTQDPHMTSLLESYDAINEVKNAARRK